MPSFKHSQVEIEWRNCPSLEGYEVSEYGHLRRNIALENHASRYPVGREYSYGLAGKGYPFYNIKVGDKRKNIYAHKLVAEAFIGARPEGMEIAHNNGDKMNCHYSNLRYTTAAENNADKIVHGTYTAGDTHPTVKLKTDQAEGVILMRELGYSQSSIALVYSVSQTAVGRFLRRLTS